MNWIVRLLGSLSHTGNGYFDQREQDASFRKNTDEINSLKASLTTAQAKLVADFVKDLNAGEAARETSIQSRAQGLLVGQAFITSMMTIGAGATVGKGPFQNIYWSFGILFLVMLVVISGLILTWNALQALSGQVYPRPAMTEFREAMAAEKDRGVVDEDTPSFQSVTAAHAYNAYRKTVIRNDWRFRHLASAQGWFWASVYSLAGLAIAVWAAVFLS